MAYFLGVDTGGTFTDAVILDQAADAVIGAAKSHTRRFGFGHRARGGCGFGGGRDCGGAPIRARARVTISQGAWSAFRASFSQQVCELPSAAASSARS